MVDRVVVCPVCREPLLPWDTRCVICGEPVPERAIPAGKPDAAPGRT